MPRQQGTSRKVENVKEASKDVIDVLSESQEEGPAEKVVADVPAGNASRTQKILCEYGCEGDDAEATHRCLQCKIAICDFCVQGHRRKAHMKSHVLTKIASSGNGSARTADAYESKKYNDSDNSGKPVDAVNGTTDGEDVGGEAGKAAGSAKVNSASKDVEGRGRSGHDAKQTAKHEDTMEEGEDAESDEGEEEEDDGNNDYCEVCRGGGELVCCDFCECAYHGLKCLNAEAEDLPDPYKCPKCTGDLEIVKAEYEKRRAEKKLAKKQKQAHGKAKRGESDGGDDPLLRKKGGGKRKKRVIDSDDEMQDSADDEEESDDDDGASDSDSDAADDDDFDARESNIATATDRRRLTRVRVAIHHSAGYMKFSIILIY